MRSSWTVFAALAIVVCVTGSAMAQTKLLRLPDIHGDRVVFTYAGDLWLVSDQGGTATRLTAHPGLELFAKFSPDGRWIAFTGQYDGDEQVYVMPATGGVPRQLSYYPARGPLPDRWGFDHQVHGWTPDGSAVLFRSMREGWALTGTRLYTVGLDGGLPEALPMKVAGAGDLSPDGSRIVYSPLTRDFRTWKRYEGGWAQDLYVLELGTLESERITDDPRTERDPMWIGDQVLFASDRTGILNLYALDPITREIRPLTDGTRWDVRWPSRGEGGRVVYEMGGELHVLDVPSGESRKLSIHVPDDGLARRPSRVSAAGLIEDFSLSPSGERALFVARGDVFTAPVEHGPTRNLTRSSGAHDKWARWSPDGSRIVYVSDADGEDEIWMVPQDGSGDPEQLTDGGSAMRYAPEWSPDGKRIAFGDKDGRLWVLTLEGRELSEVADEARGQIRDYAFSPDGGHLAFSMSDPNGFRSIYVWSVEGGRTRRVTGELFSEYSPVWDPDGDYLYYLSDREFAPQIGSFEWNYVADRETAIFAMALREDVEDPFPPRSDEVEIGSPDDEGREDEPNGADEGENDEEAEPVRIDFEGLADRVVRVPIPADNLAGPGVTGDHLLVVRTPPFYYGREGEPKPALRLFSFEKREFTTLAEDVTGYALSRDGSRVLVRRKQAGGEGSTFELYEVKAEAGKASPKPVSTSGLHVDRVPAQEWRQIFHEVWRRFRDFFYVENMHGYDWKTIRERYAEWLPHVGHRSDLNYLIGEMIAELNVSHAYKWGGDYEVPERPRVALPGALFEADEEAERYRIARILPGHNEEETYRSPLTALGVQVREGDYVVAIDGEELTTSDNPYRMLRHKADRPVTMTVASDPSGGDGREVRFEPVASETSLHYLDMVETNRRRVTEMTDGRVGYLHLPNMGAEGIREFIKWFYGQIRKEGLVVDVRNNGGGNVSQMIIERLRRELLSVDYARTFDTALTYPATVFHGHLACILNENSASDGDIFPAMFRRAGLGPLVGKRSWGGVIGITDRGPLIDGGAVRVPEFGFVSLDGAWAIENYGVDPDIEVDWAPEDRIAGRDPQLERAVREVMKRIRTDPKTLPPLPEPPVRIE